MRRFGLLELGFLIVSTTIASASCSDTEERIIFSLEERAENHPKIRAATALAARINAELDGKVCVDVVSGAALYRNRDIVLPLLEGEVQLAAPPVHVLEPISTSLLVFDLPFLFENDEEVAAFISSDIGKEVVASVERRGLKGLSLWTEGFTQIAHREEIAKPDDFLGAKVRATFEPVGSSWIDASGAEKVMLPSMEVGYALGSGIIAGVEVTWSDALRYSSDIPEVRILEANLRSREHILVASLDWWESLPKDLQGELGSIIDDFSAQQRRAYLSTKGDAVEQLDVVEMSTSARERWIEIMVPVWRSFEAEIGTDVLDAAQQ